MHDELVILTHKLINIMSRISEAETQIGAGLIEEVIQVAEGELSLLQTMVDSKVYAPPERSSHFQRNANSWQMGGVGGEATSRPMGILCEGPTHTTYASTCQ